VHDAHCGTREGQSAQTLLPGSLISRLNIACTCAPGRLTAAGPGWAGPGAAHLRRGHRGHGVEGERESRRPPVEQPSAAPRRPELSGRHSPATRGLRAQRKPVHELSEGAHWPAGMRWRMPAGSFFFTVKGVVQAAHHEDVVRVKPVDLPGCSGCACRPGLLAAARFY
jgi:hypothetical protein